ncbi:hypothetical protein ES332_A04G171200v1 [Gossypium tomentosum]|uniref:Uncharacterized protein n=1 Tax=Gossypium tomentosum TaxID=34277 RepID=A0A5D2R2R9_GOSTO|nr:hypothetical protein ES332_A04G171200v1 [Gossypium tomentosum]
MARTTARSGTRPWSRNRKRIKQNAMFLFLFLLLYSFSLLCTGVVRWGLLRRTEVVGASYGARAGAWLRHEGEGPRVSETLTFWAFRA